MNGETRILQPNAPVNVPVSENQPMIEQKNAAPSDAPLVQTSAVDATKTENRFARLKRNLRKRSASIL